MALLSSIVWLSKPIGPRSHRSLPVHPASCSFRSRVASVDPQRLRWPRGRWLSRESVSWCWTSIWNHPASPAPCCPRTAGLPTASRTGWWRTWWITAQQCSKIWSPRASFLMTERSMLCRHMERIRESMSPNSEGFGCRRSMGEDCGKTGLCA